MENERNYADAPSASTAKGIRDWLIERGARGIMSKTAVAEIVGVSKRTVKNAENAHKLPSIDKCTYELDAVVRWLLANPRYIKQDAPRPSLSPELYKHVRAMLLKYGQPLIKLYNNDVEELVSTLCYRLIKRRLTKNVSLNTVIFREIQNFSNCKETRNRRNTVLVDAIKPFATMENNNELDNL